MAMGAVRAWFLCAATACLCVSPTVCGAEDFSSLLTRAIAAFKQKKSAEAVALLREAQTLNPEAKEVAELLDKIREEELEKTRNVRRELVEMLVRSKADGSAESRELAMVVQQVLNLTTELEKTFIRDQDEIKKVIADLVAVKDRFDVWVADFQKAKNRHGWYLTPGLVPLLDHQEPGERLMAFRALASLGRDAVIPLITAIDSPSARVREEIAGILARIGDPLALSSLKYLAETDQDPVVKNAAAAAIDRLKGERDAARPAWQMLLDDAVTFIRGANELPRPQYGPYVWRMDAGALVGEEVAPFQVRRMIADMLLVRAMQAGAKPEPAAAALFVGNRAAQVQMYQENLALARQQGADEAQVTLLQGQAARIHELDQSVRLMGLDAMAVALVRALQDMADFGGAPAPVIKLIDEIRAYSPAAGANAKVAAAMQAALMAREQRVRFEASVALAALNSRVGEAAAKEIVTNLALAIAHPGIRVALVVSPDEDVRAYFGGLLNEAGFMPIVVDSATRGLLEAAAFPPKHVIFIDRNIEDLSVPSAINYIRKSRGITGVPIVVVSPGPKEAESRDLYQKEPQKVSVVADDIAAGALRAAVLDPIVKDAQDTRAEGEMYARRAAETLLAWIAARVPHDLGGAKGGLAATVEDPNRPDAVRIPAAACLGAIGDRDVLKALGAAAKAGGPVPVRVASIRALGEIVMRLGLDTAAVNADVADFADTIKACLADEDAGVRIEAARTLGKTAAPAKVVLSLDAAGK
ncbi:MAG TPA: hypothetical protein DCM87_19305 [Planctomycetes bacterium]|nr:hypothetical protein [Planctomycetota bacterium]